MTAGAAAGWWCSKLRRPQWVVGYFVPLLFIAAVALARRIPELEPAPSFSWVMAGRTEFALIALVFTLMLTTHEEFTGKWRHCGILFEASANQ